MEQNKQGCYKWRNSSAAARYTSSNLYKQVG